MQKRILALVLALVMVFSVSVVNLSVLALTTEPTITVESVQSEKGGNVAVKVLVTNNPGIWGMDLKISYDKTALTLVSVDNGDFFQASEWTKGNLNGDGYILSYEAAGFDNITTLNATLATLNFKVSDNTAIGNYAITASYNAGDIINIDFDDIDFHITNGNIKVACKHDGEKYLKDTKPTSCFEEGYTGDTYCSICNEKIADGSKIPTSNHSPAMDWSYNATHHWKECTSVGCGNKLSEDTHSGGKATCTSQAICSVCNQSYGLVADHSYTVPQKDTSYHWHKCANCDATDTKVAHTYDQKVKNANTLKTAADCDDDAVYYYSCSCGQVSTTLTFVDIDSATGNHTDANNKWETDGTKHWHTCECGEVIDEENHKGGTATCTSQAICSVCGVKYGEKNPTNHTGGTEIKDVLEAKCNTEGYTGDTYCKGCGVKISDGKAIAKTPHVVTEWTVTKEATTESTGTKSGKCNGCGETITVTTAKLVSEIKKDNIEGIDAEIEGVGETNLSEDVIFEANNVTETITAPEKTKVESSIKALTEFANKKIGAIFDLSLILRETADNGDVIAETELVLTGTVKVTIPVPTALTENLTDLKLLHIKDDGTIKEVPFTLSGGKATFETDGFSYYTFVGTEKITNEGTNNQTPSNNETETSPATGDNSNLLLWIAVMFVSVSVLAAISVINKKKKQSR